MTAASRARALADSIRATKAELPPETWCATCGLATAGTNYCATCDVALAAYVPAIASDDHAAHLALEVFPVLTHFLPSTPEEIAHIQQHADAADDATEAAIARYAAEVAALDKSTDAILAKIAPEVLHDQLADERSVTPETK